MRRQVKVLVFGLLFLLNQSLQAQDQQLSKIVQMEQKTNATRIHFRALHTGSEYDLKYIRPEWEIDPTINFIRGKICYYFTSLQSNLVELNFDFASNLTVDSVKYHEQLLSFTTTSSDVLSINLLSPISMGQLDSLTIYYQGAPNDGGFGSFVQANHGTGPIIWTLSEPFGAKEWWPTKLDLSDKIDSMDMYIITPSLYRSSGNGLLVGEYQQGNSKVYHWKHRYPITPYLVAFSVTNYAVYSDYVPLGDKSLEILNYVYPQTLSTAQTQTPAIIPIMQLFNNLFGEYPFINEKYGHAQCGFGGGMEHQTMSFMGSFNRGLIGHELAHQWFGDKVTCKSWKDIWLNEGFATYSAALINDFGVNESAWNSWKISTINSVTTQSGGSLKVDDTTSVSRIFDQRLSYEKGAYVLHMLRGMLGDDVFFTACRNYLSDSQLAYGYASTADLKHHLEIQSGKTLDSFFNDWYEGQGYPNYDILWRSEINGQVIVNIKQTTSHSSVPFFEMPVPIYFSDGTKDTTVICDHKFSNQEFVFDLSFTPTEALFDPGRWILAKYRISNFLDAPNFSKIQVSVKPNPVTDLCTFSFDKAVILSRIELYDSFGRLLKTVEFSSNHYTLSESVSFAELNQGIYTAKIIVGNKSSKVKLIKL